LRYLDVSSFIFELNHTDYIYFYDNCTIKINKRIMNNIKTDCEIIYREYY
jgi:hypothetical protein